MGDPALAPDERYTYRHYRTWPDSERWELLAGHAWAMSPAPRQRHQKLSGRFFRWLGNFLDGQPCQAFAAPFDVLLPGGDETDDDVDTVVQPDLSVFCDPQKLTERGARGAPDLVVEILSPSTSRRDQRDKFDLYAARGVQEYWIIDPVGCWLCRYNRQASGSYNEGELRERLGDYGSIASTVLPGFIIEPEKLFAE